MCLGIPAKIVHIENQMGTIDVEGNQRQVSLLLQEDAKVGDYVIVHAGFAIQKIDEEQALETLRFLHQIVAELDEKFGQPG
jgi:hydrogenase expression/formation protein HypC